MKLLISEQKYPLENFTGALRCQWKSPKSNWLSFLCQTSSWQDFFLQHTHTHTLTQAYTHMDTHTWVHIHVSTHTSVHTHINTHKPEHTHTHTSTHTFQSMEIISHVDLIACSVCCRSHKKSAFLYGKESLICHYPYDAHELYRPDKNEEQERGILTFSSHPPSSGWQARA